MDVRDQIITLSIIALIVLLGILWNQKKVKSQGFSCDVCGKEKPTSSLVCLPSAYQEEIESNKDPFWCKECADNYGLHINAILNNDGNYGRIVTPTSVPKNNPPAKT